jgi:threonine dehydrogenase-like Zn-dependent dehydrogenase
MLAPWSSVWGLGYMAVQMLRALSAVRVVAVDMREEVLQLARDAGVHAVVSARDLTPEALRAKTGRGGASLVLDCVAADATLTRTTRRQSRDPRSDEVGRKELIVQGIRVNALAAGFVDTSAPAAKDTVRDAMDASRRGLAATVPAGRMATPEDVASAAAFLASDESAYFVGATLSPNGGLVTV